MNRSGSPSFFLRFNQRREEIDSLVALQCQKHTDIKMPIDLQTIVEAKDRIGAVKLGGLQTLILKVINVVIKIFNSNFNRIDDILTSNRMAQLLHKKYSEILQPNGMEYPSQIRDSDIKAHVQTGLHYLQEIQFHLIEKLLVDFDQKTADAPSEILLKEFKALPKFLRELMATAVKERYNASVKDQPQLLREQSCGSSVLEEVTQLVHTQAEAYHQLNASQPSDDQKGLHTVIAKNDKIFAHRRGNKSAIYDVSTESVLGDIPKSILDEPITVTMVGVEYAGLIKQGGLAEAIEGMSRGIKEQNKGNRVKLIFPMYSHLPESVRLQLTTPEVHQGKEGDYNVYRLDIDGVECYFIEDPSFVLKGEKPNIYGPHTESQSTRFTKFSELAAELIWDQGDTDVIHLHDWHVSGVGLKLKKDHQNEWESGEMPPILFTFHNNNRCSQGRIYQGAYNYSPVVSGYLRSGITEKNDNLFVSTLMAADAVTTVSEMFGLESQQADYGEGVSFAVRQAAKVGKLVGIINGTNTSRWNPATDPQLTNWVDLSSGAPASLAYSPEDDDILEKKAKVREQLQLWTKQYMPHVKVDFSKPLVTYVGRFDSSQKGLDKFDEAIKSTLANGGQFIVMGMGEDPEATKILDRLEKKYPEGVLFVRDYKDPNGRIHYQQGNAERPGMGSLVRAASDFIFVPSKFEPCGLVQFEGWLFGSLAIASNTGGLADTVIPPEKDGEAFNGFLFERKGNQSTSAATVITKSLQFWNSQSPESKKAIMRRLMTEGKKYGWDSSPRGLTPSEKYRFAYENARRRAIYRGSTERTSFKLDALARKILVNPMSAGSPSSEEVYMQKLYEEGLDSAGLCRRFQKLNYAHRAAAPSPYGVQVNHKMYEEYGAFYSDDTTRFKVYAPHAHTVRLRLFDENENLSTEVPMHKDAQGNWSSTVAALKPNQRYQYVINGKTKVDPFGRSHIPSSNPDKPPYSLVQPTSFDWSDSQWMHTRVKEMGKPKPMSIFEFHPTAWKRKDQKPLNYRELADELVKHCKEAGYTHVEPMGILEHYHEGSWGYQAYGYYAPNSRLGSPEDFKYLVDHLHQNGIGVIIDWVPAHFAKDSTGLTDFDGTHLYESSGWGYLFSIRRWFFSYGSKHFDYKQKHVREFLLSSAAYWLKEMHVDGLRVDCVRSMLNSEDPDSAKLFMRDLNSVVHEHGDGAITIAEEYSGDTTITRPSWLGGLGFDMKWHVGLMRGFMDYFRTSPSQRKSRYNALKEAIQSDNFHKQVMVLSHDQLVNQGLINLTKGLSDASKLSNLKAMLSLMMCLPGKKLFFMGNDTANALPWNGMLANSDNFSDPSNEKVEPKKMMWRLHEIYKKHKEFWELDDNERDLEWIRDPLKHVHAYRRVSSDGNQSACLHNFTDQERTFTVSCSADAAVHPEEIFNSDSHEFGGLGRTNTKIRLIEGVAGKYYTVTIPPLTTLIIKEK